MPRTKAKKRGAEPRRSRSNQPDFRLKIKAMDDPAMGFIGAAWYNSKGGINIVLNPGVVISHRDCLDHFITLWPNENDDEIPF